MDLTSRAFRPNQKPSVRRHLILVQKLEEVVLKMIHLGLGTFKYSPFLKVINAIFQENWTQFLLNCHVLSLLFK